MTVYPNPDLPVSIPRIILIMARGWESKAVEQQQDEATRTPSPRKRLFSPEEAINQRQKQGLTLSRQNVVQQLERATNSAHRQMLKKALADLDAQLSRLP